MSFDEAATLPVAICTAAVSLYHDGVNVFGGTCGLTPPWEEGARGKYHDQPTVVFGGAGSVGQAGQLLPVNSRCITEPILLSYPVLEALRLQPAHYNGFAAQRRLSEAAGSDPCSRPEAFSGRAAHGDTQDHLITAHNHLRRSRIPRYAEPRIRPARSRWCNARCPS